MSQSLARVLVHLIFSTRHRSPSLDRALRPGLHAYLGGVLRNIGCPPIQIGGTADHVHLLFVLGRTSEVSKVVGTVKSNSSRWIKSQPARPLRFNWQKGFAAFSVGPDGTDRLVAYIRDQEKHHRRMTFQDELRKLFRRYGVEHDEDRVWDRRRSKFESIGGNSCGQLQDSRFWLSVHLSAP